jgi:predicted phosphodiesterase
MCGRKSFMLTLSVLTAFVLSGNTQVAEQQGIETNFAWVEMVSQVPSGGNTSVRATVKTGEPCPRLLVDGKAMPMTVREASDEPFPITTCQAYPEAGAREAVVGEQHLKLAPKQLQRIIVIGDTGCRLKGPLVQDCNDPKEWPYAQVAARAAGKHPDLVLHVGDYYYRESPCPVEHAGCSTSPHGDAWDSWSADFFEPSAPLFAAAPWILVRGNHEQCGRGSNGWFRMIDADRTVQDCAVNKTSAPFTVTLDGWKFYVMDSADTNDIEAPAELVALFAKQYEELGDTINNGHGWILTHRPIWGVDPKDPDKVPGEKKGPGLRPTVDFPSNRTEQVASDSRTLKGVDMVVSGHVHLFTTLSYGPSRPVQLIVGNGGDNPNLALAGPPIRKELVDGKMAEIYQVQRFGYLLLERENSGWKGTLYAVDDSVMAQCTFRGREASCSLTQASR